MFVNPLREADQFVAGAAVFFDEVEVPLGEGLFDAADHADEEVEVSAVHAGVVHRGGRDGHNEDHGDFAVEFHGYEKEFVRRGIDGGVGGFVIDKEGGNDEGLCFAGASADGDRDAGNRDPRSHQLKLNQIVFEYEFGAIRRFCHPDCPRPLL